MHRPRVHPSTRQENRLVNTVIAGTRHLVWLALVLGISYGCDTVQTNSDFNRTFDFSTYKTFSWISENPMIESSPTTSPLTQGRVQLAIIDVMQEKGITYVTDPKAADFVIAFAVGTRQKVRVDTTHYPIGYGGPYMWGMGYYQDIDVHEFTQGRLAIDVFDTRLRQPVWHGWGTKSVTEADQRNAEPVIRNAVDAILKDFPPGAK
jgi:Domain of unknown function (DUF4136)